jgi:hypothetical protein
MTNPQSPIPNSRIEEMDIRRKAPNIHLFTLIPRPADAGFGVGENGRNMGYLEW